MCVRDCPGCPDMILEVVRRVEDNDKGTDKDKGVESGGEGTERKEGKEGKEGGGTHDGGGDGGTRGGGEEDVLFFEVAENDFMDSLLPPASIITDAFYGHPTDASQGRMDVTAVIRDRVAKDLLIMASNDLLGDPAPGKAKVLRIQAVSRARWQYRPLALGDRVVCTSRRRAMFYLVYYSVYYKLLSVMLRPET